jgi:hypothetical protein
MHLTRRNKTLLAVFVVGLMALAADQTILRPEGGPQAAGAADSRDSALLSIALPTLEDKPQEPGLAKRLSRFGPPQEPDFSQARNPFALPPSWSGTPHATGKSLPEAVARFLSTHQLAAIVLDGERSYILVDDRVLVPGQALDGFTLVSVEARAAIFESQGQRATLELLK